MARKSKREPAAPRGDSLPAGTYCVLNGLSFPAPTDEDPKAERYAAPGETVRADELTPAQLAEYIRHGDLEAPAASGPAVGEDVNLPATEEE